MNGETWQYPSGEFCVLCPKCNTGTLLWEQLFDWPPFLGGDFVDDVIRCTRCGTEWEFEASFPPGTFDEHEQLIGWSLNGFYINGCEGPVRVDKKHYYVTYEVQDRDTYETLVNGSQNIDAYNRQDAIQQLKELKGKYGFLTVWDIEEVNNAPQ